MHRRNRHIAFSAKNAGGDVVLDARTIKGVSDGGNVNTWRDLRDGSAQFTYNNPFFGVPGAPTYVSNAQAGQPGVRFTTAGRFMSRAWSTNPTNYVWISTDVPKLSTGNSKHLVSTTDGSFNQVNFSVTYFGSTVPVSLYTDLRNAASVSNNLIDTYVVDRTHIQSFGIQTVSSVSTGRAFKNNYSYTLTNGFATNTTYITLGGRNGCCDYAQSDMLQFLFFNSYISKPLRRRFEIASSFTFKIRDILNATNN